MEIQLERRLLTGIYFTAIFSPLLLADFFQLHEAPGRLFAANRTASNAAFLSGTLTVFQSGTPAAFAQLRAE